MSLAANVPVDWPGLDSHDLRAVCYTYGAAVAGLRGDDARHVRAVALVVLRVARARDEVDAVHVVGVAVAVVVGAVEGLVAVLPHGVGQVDVAVVDARVDDGHHGALAGVHARGVRLLPRGLRVDGVELPGFVHLFDCGFGVAANCGVLPFDIRFGVEHFVAGIQRVDGAPHVVI